MTTYHRDDRVLVTDDDMTPSEWPIMPTFQYLKTDIRVMGLL